MPIQYRIGVGEVPKYVRSRTTTAAPSAWAYAPDMVVLSRYVNPRPELMAVTMDSSPGVMITTCHGNSAVDAQERQQRRALQETPARPTTAG